MIGTHKKLLEQTIVLLIALGGFWMVVGFSVLGPTNIAWLQSGDPATHYLGWVFFRHSPWTLPPGANPGYGLEISSGIFFSDSIPILAIVAKTLRDLLPEPFQYIGIWLLGCFIGQGLAAHRLGELLRLPIASRLAFCAFCIMAPPFLWRLHGHYALCGHWLILAAFCLYVDNCKERSFRWPALLAFASMVHSYLLVMVAGIWMAALISRVLDSRLSIPSAFAELLIGIGLSIAGLWAGGFFEIKSGWVAGSYGFFALNLIAPFDPRGWSLLLRGADFAKGQYETFNFLGVGLFVLLVTCPFLMFDRSVRLFRVARWGPIAVVLSLFCIFAISCKVWFGSSVVLQYPLPELGYKIGNVLRASARMFWPCYYAIMAAPFVLLSRLRSAGTCALIASVGAIVQIVDLIPGWSGFRKAFNVSGTVWQTPLNSRFWDEAALSFKRVRLVPIGNQSPNWMPLAYFAGNHGLATDAVYLARVDERKLSEARVQLSAQLDVGNLDKDAFYVLNPAWRDRFASISKPEDFLGTIDGLLVYAPHFRHFFDSQDNVRRNSTK